jgi:hypothetical protein
MNFTTGGIGAAALILFILFWKRDIFATFRLILAIVGVCLIASAAAGALGFNLLLTIVQWVENLLSDLTNALIGVRVGALLLLLVLGVEVFVSLHPKNKASKHAGWAGVGLVLVLLVGVSQLPALSHIPGDIRQGVSNAQTSVQSGGH